VAPIEIPLVAKLTCPHCLVAFKSEWNLIELGSDRDARWRLDTTECPTCDRLVMRLMQFETVPGLEPLRGVLPTKLKAERMIWPKATARVPVPATLPQALADDYTEACNVLADSAKASAALSRRCLQNLLIEKAGVTKNDLYDQIQEVLDKRDLPTPLAEDLDAVRVIGNFAAHPMKSKATGQIVDVLPGEAEWNLEVLEGLFDYYFVQPEKKQQRRVALNAKLGDAGKPPLR
jgi:hypothetical protein